MSGSKSAAAPEAKRSSYGSPFWEGVREGRLMMQVCPATGKVQHPPRPISFGDGGRSLEWREVSGKGRIYTFTVNRRPAPGFEGRTPYVVAVIDLPEKVRVIANVEGAPERMRIGAPVRLAHGLSPTGDLLFELGPEASMPGW